MLTMPATLAEYRSRSHLDRRRLHMDNGSAVSRRTFMGAVGAMAGAAALAPTIGHAQAPAGKPADPASTITTPPRD
jgi:hypothetical protein